MPGYSTCSTTPGVIQCEMYKVKCLQNQLNSIIESNKQKYYSHLSNKLADPMTSTKSHVFE